MAKIPDATKHDRLERIDILIQRHPDGLTEREIAEALNFERRTTHNYLQELDLAGRIYKEGQYWYPLPHQSLIVRHHEFRPEETVILYLASRLFVKQSDQRNEVAESLLLKLADTLSSDIGLGSELYEAAKELAQRPKSPNYEDVFRTVVRGYVYKRKVRIVYRPYRGASFETVISPYLLEPSAIGFTTYVVGHSSIVDRLRTYKIQRIESAQLLLQEEYSIPDNFPGLQLLHNAWSIYYGDEVIRVVLRFHPGVARRVQETNWHPSQKLSSDDQRPGYLVLTLDVADATDLKPWIRTWGADCEVLEPEWLREELIREVQKYAMLYQLNHLRPLRAANVVWGKADRETNRRHLLLYHMLDVALVARRLWQAALDSAMKEIIAGWLGVDVDAAGQLVAFWAGLHDIGKASPAFQRKFAVGAAELIHFGLEFSDFPQGNPAHGLITAHTLPALLVSELSLDPDLAKKLASAVGGHHGMWFSALELDSEELNRSTVGDENWNDVRHDIFLELQKVLGVPRPACITLTPEDENALLAWLSGFTSVADWIGSAEEFFPFEGRSLDLTEYAGKSSSQADQALRKLGWTNVPIVGDLLSFAALFPSLPGPNSIQDAIINTAEDFQPPALVVLEAPTGIGKTEAALYLVDILLQTEGARGVYIAMPTQATTNQMFSRVHSFLQERYPHDIVNYQLLHGQAQWLPEAQKITLQYIDEQQEATVAAMSWFLPRKRGLLAQFAVGTVDQALLSILPSRHFFVRLFGLSHKVIVFDEVHAYDTYMATLFFRLLEWLKQLNTSVIILSATLPHKTRQHLVESYAGKAAASNLQVDTSYPRLTIADATGTKVLPLPLPPSRTINIEWIPRDAETIVQHLAYELTEGGCVAIICNTVGRAQDIFRAIQDSKIVPEESLILFHAQFPFTWRTDIEKRVVETFGKQGIRPASAVVVATQVVEQSLDLDFDLIITDPAPVDLILQRAGRLHRHIRDHRPTPLREQRLVLTAPDTRDSIPQFGPDSHVYDDYTLLASTLILSERDRLHLPNDTTELIETVYGDLGWISDYPEELQIALRSAHSVMSEGYRMQRSQARQRMVCSPDDEDMLTRIELTLDEDDPVAHPTLQAMTRLIEPGISLVCLHERPFGVALEPDDFDSFDPFGSLSNEEVKDLLQRTVTIRHKTVLKALINEPAPRNWEAIAALRFHRLAVFSKGQWPVPGTPFVLRLSRKTGLEIVKEE